MPQRLADLLSKPEAEFAWAVKSCQLLSLWEQIVDERVKKQTTPIKITNRTLFVSASTSTWAQELSFLKKEIIKKFNEKAGEEVIRDVRFKAGG